MFLSKVPNRIAAIRKTLSASGDMHVPVPDKSYDVVIMGYGAAGAAAALEAAAAGAQVLVIDGSVGGGSTQRSGGVIYLGGGTQSQIDAGFEDDAENMYRCLKIESEGAVDDDRMRAFCEESKGNFEFLRDNGVKFADPSKDKAVYWPKKASLPPGDSTIYWSGNEEAQPWASAARPAPRGHWPWFPGCGVKNEDSVQAPTRGHVLFNALDAAVTSNPNIVVQEHCRGVTVLMENGRASGLRVRALPDLPAIGALNQMLYGIATMTEYDFTGNARRECMRISGELFEEFGQEHDVTATKGVIISAGGYFFNDSWVEKYAPDRRGNMPLGNMGDDGSGIATGQGAGGAITMMNRCTTWKFMAPPNGFLSAAFVDTKCAQRFSNEDVYNAKLVDRQFARADGKAWCIIDSKLYQEIEAEIQDGSNVLYGFQRWLSVISLKALCKQGNSWAQLARACGLPADGLEKTMERYNDDARRGGDTNFGKQPKYLRPLDEPPFYAVWVDGTIGAPQRALLRALPIAAPKYMTMFPMLPLIKAAVNLGVTMPPSPTFSLGGLHVDISQRVLNEKDLKPIPGLYAAGRSASGVATGGYVSGLSIADAVFAGRRAARHATLGVADATAAAGFYTGSLAGREMSEVPIMETTHASKL